MDRKQFLKRFAETGASMCCCGSLLAGFRDKNNALLEDPSKSGQGWIAALEKRKNKGSETPDWKKFEKAQEWIKSLMDNMDAMLDRETRKKLIQECGRTCSINAYGAADEEKPSDEQVKINLKRLMDGGLTLERNGDDISFTFGWGPDHPNPWGLFIRDGYCMCPVVETGPKGLSPTYCFCSTGYVREGFVRDFGRPVDVELLDSLKMGGKDCIFRVTVHDVRGLI